MSLRVALINVNEVSYPWLVRTALGSARFLAQTLYASSRIERLNQRAYEICRAESSVLQQFDGFWHSIQAKSGTALLKNAANATPITQTWILKLCGNFPDNSPKSEYYRESFG